MMDPPDRAEEMEQWENTLVELSKEDERARKKDLETEPQVTAALKKLQREAGFPSYSTFYRARWHSMFNDVKKREKHFHVRCSDCASLTTKLHKALNSVVEKALYEKLLKAHHFEVKQWRQLETTLQTQARSSPGQVIVLSYDDTSSMRFPRMTNRHVKGVPKDKVKMTPFNLTNHGTGENFYLYDFEGKWKKVADRLCTILFHVLRRSLHRAPDQCTPSELAQRICRKLVLMADNASGNKNNVVFQFCSELLLRKWFDEVQLLFGPVGHTHNGNDAVHFIHNQIAGNYVSITPAELFLNYNYAWLSERTRPQPVILEAQYGWHERYAPYQNNVKGFTNTSKDPLYVRAFRFTWNADGVVVMHIKGSPSSPVWYGIDSIPDGPGFVCLRGLPPGAPWPKDPCEFSLPERYITSLNNDSMKKYCNDNDRSMMHPVLMQMATTLVVPSTPVSIIEEQQSGSPHSRHARAGFGSVERIGLGQFTYLVPFIRAQPSDVDESTFWRLPEDILSGMVGAPGVAPEHLMSAPVPIPVVQYSHVVTKRKQSLAVKKPVARKRSTYGRGPRKDVSDESSESSPSEDEKEELSQSGPVEPVPVNWPALEVPSVKGAFVVVEAVYGTRRKEIPGISVSQVGFLLFFSELRHLIDF